MAAEVLKQWSILLRQKEEKEAQVGAKKKEAKDAFREIKDMKAQQAKCLKARREEENRAFKNEQGVSAIQMQIYAVQRDISVGEIELDELNWELSRVFFSGTKRKKIMAQIKEKKAENASHQDKLKILKKQLTEQKALPRYVETIAHHTEIYQEYGTKGDELKAHYALMQSQRGELNKELAALKEELAQVEEKIKQMIKDGELTEEEREKARAGEFEEEVPEVPEVPEETEEPKAASEGQTEEILVPPSRNGEEDEEERTTLSIRNVRRPGESKLSIRNVNRPSSKPPKGPLYAPGEEPEEIKEKLKDLFEKLEEAYPDHIVMGLNANHRQLGKKVTELYRQLKYDSGAEFLSAYGFTSKRRRPWG